MRTVVHLDTMHMTLPDVAQITCSYYDILAHRDVYRKLLPKAEGITGLRKAYIPIGVTASYLIVTLPELRREHHAHKGHVGLVSKTKVLTP